jgi:hypothetical protein
MAIDNTEKSGVTDLWVAGTLPWQADLPWYYPTFTRINNIEQS